MSLETEASDQLLMALEDDELRFNSTTLKELSKALQDDSINIIGLHGERGSGKTTLVGVVRDKAKSLNMFYAVLFVSMSKIPNPSKIRDLIAEQLNQIFGRAKELKSTLGMNQILVILDDVLAKFDPKKCMGISCNDPQCKFLLTARSDQDCILLMGEREVPCQKMIPMGPLSSEDTWRLLQKHSGIEDDKSNLSNVRNEIAFNYEWFPGSTIGRGSLLKGRPYKEWKGILDGLIHASTSASCDIFLSFRGMDSDRFTSDLCAKLRNINRFKIFMKDDEYGDEDSTSPEHVKAIEDSILSIVVLSENYVASAKCLDELVHILKCRKTKNQLVWPIYYGWQSSFIKNHGNQEDIITNYCNWELEKKINKDPKKIEKWRSALLEVSRLDSDYAKRNSDSILRRSDRTIIKNYVRKVETAEIFLYKQSKDKAEEIEWSNADCEFELFFTQQGRLLVALEEDEIRFNSTTLKELSKELQDDSINKIGLHGKQGSGKTTLVEAVYDKVKCLKIFDAILFATVSQNPDIWSIQDQFAESLSLKLENEGDFGRALEIRLTLSGMNRILVILDDVPAKFDSERCMGVSCNDERCKFLLTTRHKQGCTLRIGKREIHCQKMIPMGPLSPKDAWRMLQQHSSIEDNKSNLSNVANEIASYEWFPGSIIEIGRSLKGKPYKEWEGLLNSLRHSTARYQIFLSFRGIDTRHPFTSTLCAELRKNGFKTFMDDTGLGNGDSISTQLVKAIEDSRLSIVVLSEHYSNSSWCLDELVHILECKKTKKQLVWPIFYKVEPTHVRHQTGGFGKAMAEVEEKFKNDPEKIKKWKSALVEVAQLSGRPYDEGTSEAEFIQEYVEVVKKAKNYLYIRNMDPN